MPRKHREVGVGSVFLMLVILGPQILVQIELILIEDVHASGSEYTFPLFSEARPYEVVPYKILLQQSAINGGRLQRCKFMKFQEN